MAQSISSTLLLIILSVAGLFAPIQATRTMGAAQAQEKEEADEAYEELPPLTKDGIDLYLRVMRTAADRMKRLPPQDQALIKKMTNMNSWKGGPPTSSELDRYYQLTSMDETIAQEMGVSDAYQAARGKVTDQASICPAPCGESEGESGTPPESSMSTAEEKQLEAEQALVKPHLDEIRKLEAQVRPSVHLR
ncbi:MAG: hypothetical protein K0Q60_2812 [Microvirga sp.]|jgi:hypothetical protein|nr:hypothetical protein [Microvirga sp.]MCD6069700.1 hypothetical protein [Microvirga sp.]